MEEYLKGRGAQIKTGNRFLKNQYVTEHPEGLDEPLFDSPNTQIFFETPKKIVNKVESPDLSMMYSLNPTRVVSTAVFIAMRATHMNIMVSVPGWILKVR